MKNKFISSCEQYIKNGGILEGASFSPVEIPLHELIDTTAAGDYMEKNRGVFFVQQLLSLIDRTGKKDSEIYKKAGIDRRLFSKIRSDTMYAPSKKTVLSLCVALELSREDADLLLSSAGYSLSRASNFDLVIAFCIEKKEYNLHEINEVLDHFGFELF
jgi:hypothetical protein